jgi:Zn-dependent metalloprotease/subtilisin-like proprotein convertase family protein
MSQLPRKTVLAALAVTLGVLSVSIGSVPALSQGDDPRARAEAHLRANADRLGLPPDLHDLQFVGIRQGLSGQHVRYQQTLGGVPVFGQLLTVNLPKDERSTMPPLVTGHYRRPMATSSRAPGLSAPDALNIVRGAVSLSPDNLRGAVTTDLIYYPVTDGRLTEDVLAWQVIAPTVEPLGTWLFVIRADTGELLLRQNVLLFDSGQVFDPNPARSSGGLFPPPGDCDSASNASSLSSEYASRTLLGLDEGQDRLIGEFVDLSAPGLDGAYKPAAVADEPSHNYVYGCDDDRFEEVMVYSHIDTVQRKIQSLGFSGASGIVDRPIPAHAHYFADCNAFYDPTDLGLHFGDGDTCSPSTDAAEDADVIVHEYGHAIQYDQVPGWGFGAWADVWQAWAMGEGFGDFLAAAISGDPCLGEWFNVGETACGGSPGLRSLENGATFDGSTVTNLPSWCPTSSDPHCAGLAWGGALWDLVQALGGDQAARDTVLTLVLDGQFSLDPQSTFAEAAAAIRQSDTLLYAGAHVSTIDSVFSARGISSTGTVSDFPYAYLRIIHPSRGDLDVQLKVGPDVNSPLCSVNVWDPNPLDGGDDLVGFVDLTGDPCAAHLPPSPSTPWHLEVRDVFKRLTGTIEQFEIALSGAVRCIATDVPVPIPDKDGFVYSSLDCSTTVSPPGDNDGDTIPDPVDTDDDNDGFSDTSELFIGTDQLSACADTPTPDDESIDKWPADFNDNQVSDIFDIVLLAPPFFGARSTDPNYSARKDFNGDGVIDLFDIVRLTPPIFGTHCQ